MIKEKIKEHKTLLIYSLIISFITIWLVVTLGILPTAAIMAIFNTIIGGLYKLATKKRAKLTISYKKDKPYIYEDSGEHLKSIFMNNRKIVSENNYKILSIGVKNVGKAIADLCEAKIEICNESQDKIFEDFLIWKKNYDPLENSDNPHEIRRPIKIHIGEEQLLNFLKAEKHTQSKTKNITISLISYNHPPGKSYTLANIMEKNQKPSFNLKITIYSDNLNPKQVNFKLKTGIELQDIELIPINSEY